VVGSCEHSNEPSGSMKGGEFLDWLSILLLSQEELCSMELVIIFKYCTVLYCIKKYTKLHCNPRILKIN
jgi:hypothetical protein